MHIHSGLEAKLIEPKPFSHFLVSWLIWTWTDVCEISFLFNNSVSFSAVAEVGKLMSERL